MKRSVNKPVATRFFDHYKDKRGFSADSVLLLLSALRPRLLLPLKMLDFGQNSRKIVVLLAIFSIFSVFFAKNPPVSATSVTLTIPSNPISLSVNPTANNGFASSRSSISAGTDSPAGYSLSIKAKNSADSNSLINDSNTSFKLLSIASPLTADEFKSTGTANTWGFSPSKVNGEENSKFLPGPTTEDTLLEKTEAANSDPNSYDIDLAAKVDSALPAGNYTNTFIVTAVSNALPYLPMQNWQGCDSLEDDEIITLRDERDDSTYRVAKLADGKCWMIDNLKIMNTTIHNTDSDISASSWPIPASTTSGYDSYDANQAYYDGAKDGDIDYGALYSWYAATAGTGTYSMSTNGQEASGSICPKGWRLPKGGANGDFVALDKAMGGTGSNRTDATARDRFIKKPIPGFTYAGYMYYGSLNVRGSGGYYWSSTVSNNDYAYFLYFFTLGNIYPQNNYYKYNGYSVRCIARDPDPSPELLTQQWTADADDINVSVGKGIEMIMIADGSDNWKPYYAFPGKDVNLSGANGKKYIISVVPEANKVMTKLTKENGKISATGGDGAYESMQDLTDCTEQGTNVMDTRNGVSYTVAKIGNKCWMLSNLRLAAGTVLNSSTSNVSSNFTLPTASWTDSNTSPIMKECHGTAGNDSSNTTCNNTATGITEYYYNRPAAKAGTSSVDSGGYSICPKNWTLPNYNNDVTAANTWNSGNNPGMLATVGLFLSSTQDYVGSRAYWWSSAQVNSDYGYLLTFRGSGALRDGYDKFRGFSVRCMLQDKSMQKVSEWKSGVKAGSVVTATDERDGSTYRVARLDDGKLWMIDNLKIMNTTIHNTDSDISATSWTIPSSTTSGYNSNTYDGNLAYYDGAKDGDVDYGALYSWYAATAGSGTYSMSSNEASSSICPKGWRLPKGGTSGDFVALDKAMGGDGSNRTDAATRDKFIKKPTPGFLYAGCMFNGSLNNRGDHGYYWSSTMNSRNAAHNLYFYSQIGYIYPLESDRKYNGYSVRCVARE